MFSPLTESYIIIVETEFTMNIVYFTLILPFSMVSGIPTTPPNLKNNSLQSSLKELDATNLQTLNRETRKALLKIVGDELSTAHAVMKSIESEVNDCQQKVDQKYYDCVQCVDMKCQNRYKECNGSIQISAPNSGGVSVSNSVNDRGRPITTICTVMWGQSKACTTVMNPEGAFATSIKSMGDTMHVHLRSVMNDFGGSAGMFVNQMHSVVGDMNTSRVANEAVERMLNELNTDLGGMQYELQHMFDGVGNDIHQSMTGMDHTLSQIGPNVNQMVSQIGPNVNQMVSQIGPNVNQMWSNTGPRMQMIQQGPQMHQSLTQIGPNVNRMVSHIGPMVNMGVKKNVNNMLQNLHQGLGQWRHNFGQSLNHMLSNMFGRKKRQAQIISDPLHEVKCDVMSKNSTVCAEYRTRCQSCPQTSNITDGDVIQEVCGDVIVGKINQINLKLEELEQIEATVISDRNILTKVELDQKSLNPDTFAFSKLFVTAKIKGQPLRFHSKSELKIMDLPSTGQNIAKQIWNYWNDAAIHKPK
ncbi:uncharacterized protein LOC127731105 [Mytilus californianus]|uniref:uncharacterized protein LOC127731105 n=1 Tax=Mytilus californianus TaxID=6549 RepID=UPI0022468535|nr:uncharacterized protein LOC127731105 [Mytilus californianus]